ncbi:MAG TPA: sugar ABC transporter permease [Clostridiales bacterium]|nr:sugar ABC transporter permease [Clostridiales bacterium]
MKKFRLKMKYKHMLEGYILLLPWIIGTVLFFIVPIYQSIFLSFSKLVKITEFKMKWVGLIHYQRALFFDIWFVPVFISMIKETLTNTPLIIIFSLFIAMLLNKNTKFKGFFRGVYVLPIVLGTGYVMSQLLGIRVISSPEGAPPPMVVSGELSRGLLIPEEMLIYLGPTITKAVTLFLSKITMMLWKSGVQIVLFLGGLQSISKSLYEAAHCDGATEWEMFWKITFPIISPTILLSIVYTIADSFTDASNPMVQKVMQLGFNTVQFEYAAAISWIYLAFIMLLIGLVFLVFRIGQNSIESKKVEV